MAEKGFRPYAINCFEIVLKRGEKKRKKTVFGRWIPFRAPLCVPIRYLHVDRCGGKGEGYTNPFMFAVRFVFTIHRSETLVIGISARYAL